MGMELECEEYAGQDGDEEGGGAADVDLDGDAVLDRAAFGFGEVAGRGRQVSFGRLGTSNSLTISKQSRRFGL